MSNRAIDFQNKALRSKIQESHLLIVPALKSVSQRLSFQLAWPKGLMILFFKHHHMDQWPDAPHLLLSTIPFTT